MCVVCGEGSVESYVVLKECVIARGCVFVFEGG